MSQIVKDTTEWGTIEVKIRVPANDPRFAAMREELRKAQGPGRKSRCPRMLLEWALLGRALTRGELGMQQSTDTTSPSASRSQAQQ